MCKQSLKKCQAAIDMITDKAAIFGSKIDLNLSTSGDYCVDILPNFTSNEPSEEVLILEKTIENDAKTDSLDMLQ